MIAADVLEDKTLVFLGTVSLSLTNVSPQCG